MAVVGLIGWHYSSTICFLWNQTSGTLRIMSFTLRIKWWSKRKHLHFRLWPEKKLITLRVIRMGSRTLSYILYTVWMYKCVLRAKVKSKMRRNWRKRHVYIQYYALPVLSHRNTHSHSHNSASRQAKQTKNTSLVVWGLRLTHTHTHSLTSSCTHKTTLNIAEQHFVCADWHSYFRAYIAKHVWTSMQLAIK